MHIGREAYLKVNVEKLSDLFPRLPMLPIDNGRKSERKRRERSLDDTSLYVVQ